MSTARVPGSGRMGWFGRHDDRPGVPPDVPELGNPLDGRAGGRHIGPRPVASYAVMLGRAATVSYQRRSAVLPAGMGISNARVAKSTVTSVVMSAAEN
ncbi:MAG: hypothetical protein QOH05_3649 [Acetobacteraceae bacterium]|jgi:hypothetical protein|nr:hypothetical protein [Acetobacteraceae bacterium]